MTTLSVRNSIGRPPLRRRVSLTAFALALACFAPSPPARALNPAPDGGYPNANTAEGVGALNSLNTNSGGGNTAMGFFALQTLTAGSNNTAIGVQALNSNTPANSTPPSVLLRSLTTQPPTSTLPPVITRS